MARLDKLESQITSGVKRSVGEAESKLAGRFSTFGKNMGRNLLAGVGITFAAAGLIKFIGSSVQAAQEAEQSQLKLNQAFKIFPALANVNIESLRKLNTQMSFKTKFDDDALASGQAVLAQFKLTGQQIQEITPLLADYAAKTGMDIPSAATALGRAFLGNTRALKTIGINFKATGDIAKDYTNIVGLLRQKVGGFAEAEGKTFSGRLEILKTQFGEVKESIGRAVLPILSGLAKIVVQDVIPRLGQFAALLKETFGPLFSSIVSTAKAFLPILKDVGTVVGVALVGALKLLGAILQPLAPIIAKVGAALVAVFIATKVTAAIQAIVVSIKTLAAVAAEPLFGKAFMGGLTTQTTAATGGLTALKGALTRVIGLFNPLTIAITGSIAVLYSLSKLHADNAQKAREFGDALKQEAEGAKGAVNALILQRIEQLGLLESFNRLGIDVGRLTLGLQGQTDQLGYLREAFNRLPTADKLKFSQIIQNFQDGAKESKLLAGAQKDLAAALGPTATAMKDVGNAAQEAATKVLGMSRTDLTNWEKQTTSNMHFVNASLSDLAGQANLTATEILRSFDKQLRALADYNRNFQRLINRNVPSDLLKQLADMGQQGAGIVAALATANEKDFQRILRDWRNGRLAARGVANEVEGMATRINKATASIVSRRRTFLLDLVVTPSLQRIIEQSGRGTVLKGELLRFQEGGMVPGPVGAPQLAVVHGGERVLTPNQQIQNTTGDTYNVNISTSEKKVVEDLGAFLRRRQLLRQT